MGGPNPRVARYVYFVRPVGHEGPIKIGCSELPEQRLKTLAEWSPYELEIAATVPGSFRLERDLHDRFFHLRIHREWFRAGPDLVGLVAALRSGVPLSEAVDLSIKTGRWRRRIVFTANQRLYLSYAARLRNQAHKRRTDRHYFIWPKQVGAVLRRWSNNYEAVPTAEEIAFFDLCLASPDEYLVAEPLFRVAA